MKCLFLLTVALLAAGLCSLCPVAAQTGPWLDLSPYQGSVPQGTVQIPQDNVQILYARIGWDGHQGELVHLNSVGFGYGIHGGSGPGSGSVTKTWLTSAGEMAVVNDWFPWVEVHTIGLPNTEFGLYATVTIRDASSVVYGQLASNTVYEQVVPEPGALASLALCAGSASVLVRRRRR